MSERDAFDELLDTYYSEEMCEMRREFAKLIAKNPEAFAACAKEYQDKGAEHFRPGEQKDGRPPFTWWASAMLLIDYRIRNSFGRRVTRREFLDEAEDAGRIDANRFTRFKTRGFEDRLKNAEQLEKIDQKFADFVQSMTRFTTERGKTK